MQWRKAISCFGLPSFSRFWEFLLTSPCLCNSAKHDEAARASIFSEFFFLLEWKMLLGLSTYCFILSKCHQAHLAPTTNLAKSWVLAELVS